MNVNAGDTFYRASDGMVVRVMAVAEGWAMVVKTNDVPGMSMPFSVLESALAREGWVWARIKATALTGDTDA